ncbi:Photosystem II reaction center protein K [Bienertia sinuspersici]
MLNIFSLICLNSVLYSSSFFVAKLPEAYAFLSPIEYSTEGKRKNAKAKLRDGSVTIVVFCFQFSRKLKKTRKLEKVVFTSQLSVFVFNIYSISLTNFYMIIGLISYDFEKQKIKNQKTVVLPNGP